MYRMGSRPRPTGDEPHRAAGSCIASALPPPTRRHDLATHAPKSSPRRAGTGGGPAPDGIAPVLVADSAGIRHYLETVDTVKGPTFDVTWSPNAVRQSDPAGKEEMEKMRNTIGGMGPSLKEGSLQLKTDTTVTGGPWDEAAVLSGLTFAAVRKDVYISMALQMLGEAKARALVAKAMSRI